MPPRTTIPRKGTCRAIFAVTGVVDEVTDFIVPGAFAHTLATRPVKTVWHHEWKEPIGVVQDIAEWQPGDPRFSHVPNWPSEAGALVATVQFNLRTSKGRDVYEQVRQWHEHGEAQFSIGYRVPPSGATKRADGVRVIHKLDLYEVSPVLHGAHPMTRSLEVKADDTGMERKTTQSKGREELPEPGPSRLDKNGLGRWASPEAKTARIAVLEAKAAGGLDKNRGNAEQLRHWYVHGEGAAQIGWGAAGDFNRCVTIASRHMSPADARGYCNLRHHDALGIYPATHAAESKSARAAVLEAKTRTAPAPTGVPMPSIQPLPPSYEQTRDRVAQAVRRLLAAEDGTWSCVEATYPDRAIVSVHQSDAEPTTYAIPYEAVGPDVTLGTPEPVELTTVVIPDQGPAREATGAEASENRVVQPTVSALADITARIQAAEGPGQLAPVRATVRELMDTLSAKGIDIPPGDNEHEPSPAAPASNGIDLWDDDPYDEDHSDTHDMPALDDTGPQDDEPENTVRLGADEVKAQLVALQLQR